MDNLYILAKFLRGAFVDCSSKVMVHGVCRTSGHGLPKCVIQRETSNSRRTMQMSRNKTKAAVLVGDPACLNLVAFSVYDKKPVHFLSMAAEHLKWVTMSRSVYDKTNNKKVDVSFYRTNLQNEYNFGMNSVDVADQLRSSYSLSHWIRNRKWWWELFMWGFGVMLVNAYQLYRTASIYIWCKDNTYIMTQYDFRKAIALAWIKPTEYQKKCGKQFPSSSSQASTSSLASSRSKRYQESMMGKAIRVTDHNLSLQRALCMRLDQTASHLPNNDVKSLKQRHLVCALHRWADRRVRFKDALMICSHCNITLCLWCYAPFHSIRNVEDLRKEINYIMVSNNHCPQQHAS